jgi:hypothetical protein
LLFKGYWFKCESLEKLVVEMKTSSFHSPFDYHITMRRCGETEDRVEERGRRRRRSSERFDG